MLGRLVDKSLVLAEEVGGARRYRLLETVRQYAEEKLRASGELTEVRQRHRDWYLALSDAAYPELNGRHHGDWMRRLSAEHDNLRAALAWCRDSPDGAALGLRLAANLGWYFVSSHRFGEGCRWLDEFLARVPRRDALRARALEAAARIRLHDGDVPATRNRAEELLAVARDVGDESGRLEAEARVALVEASEGAYPAARARLERCSSAARAMGDVEASCMWTLDLGVVAIAAGDDAQARPLLEEALRLYRAAGLSPTQAVFQLGVLARQKGDLAGARRILSDAARLAQEAGMVRGFLGAITQNLGLIAEDEGDLAAARTLYARSFALLSEAGMHWLQPFAVEGLATLAFRQGRLETCVVLAGAAAAARGRTGSPIPSFMKVRLHQALDPAREQLGAEAAESAWSLGQAMTQELAVAYALEEDRR